MTAAEFLAKYTPSDSNPCCTCSGAYTCVYCESTQVVRDLAALPSTELDNIVLSQLQRRLLNAVRHAGKHGIIASRLVDYLYQDDVDGGPLDVTGALGSVRRKLNKRLTPLGWRVSGTSRGGTAENYWFLERLT